MNKLELITGFLRDNFEVKAWQIEPVMMDKYEVLACQLLEELEVVEREKRWEMEQANVDEKPNV